MKIIYKPYMVKRIAKAIQDATLAGKEIEKIKLDAYEWEQLKDECVQNMGPEEWYRTFCQNYGKASDGARYPIVTQVLGVPVEKEKSL
jgi:hypothetical protein